MDINISSTKGEREVGFLLGRLVKPNDSWRRCEAANKRRKEGKRVAVNMIAGGP